MKTEKSKELLFKEHQHLAVQYAGKVFKHNMIGMDKEDILQEFRIKLFEVILAHERSTKMRTEKGLIKPVPLPFYIKASFNNFVKDYIRKISRTDEIFVNNTFLNNYDHSSFNPNFVDIDTNKNKYEINGFDILNPLKGKQRQVFIMYLKGNKIDRLTEIFGRFFNVSKVIKKQKEYLQSRQHLFEIENVEEFHVVDYQEN